MFFKVIFFSRVQYHAACGGSFGKWFVFVDICLTLLTMVLKMFQGKYF